jgi:uncharacterized membrane protein (DUF2068 family)
VKSSNDRAVGIRLIVAYKVVRGVISLTLAAILGVAALRDGGTWLRELASSVRGHFMGMWAVRLADLLVRASTPRSLGIGAAALTVDGAFVLFEGWSLRRGFSWAPWLVIVATSVFLPFEAYELGRGIRAGRLVFFLANIAVVVYLVRRRYAESRSTRSSPSPKTATKA